jgi:hypothetical protein
MILKQSENEKLEKNRNLSRRTNRCVNARDTSRFVTTVASIGAPKSSAI